MSLPSIHQLIRVAGVMVKTRTCQCCGIRPLYEICATPSMAAGQPQDFFYVCAHCDVSVEQRGK